MPSDNPVSAIQDLNASDERQRSPVSKYAKQVLAIARLVPGAHALTLVGIGAAVEWLGQREQENRDQLANVLAEELKYRGAQVERLMATSEEHRRFMAEELPGLILDALRRADSVRAKERIGRMARILARTLEIGPGQTADHVEEMLRIAVDLGERDVLVLRTAVEAAAAMERTGTRRLSNSIKNRT